MNSTFAETCRRLQQECGETRCKSTASSSSSLENLNTEAGLALAEALLRNDTRSLITTLSLARCSLTSDFTSQLELVHILYLDLQCCELDDDAIEALCENLQRAAAQAITLPLKYLNLAGNSIGDVGACAICETVGEASSSSRLQVLHIQNNSIRDLGAEALTLLLASSYEEGGHLKELICYNNPFGKRGRTYLQEAATQASLAGRILLWNQDDEEDGSETSQTVISTSVNSFSSPIEEHMSVSQDPLFTTSTTARQRNHLEDREYRFEALLQKFQPNDKDGDGGEYDGEDSSTDSSNIELCLDQAFLRLVQKDESLKCIDLTEITPEYAHSIAFALLPTVRELCLTYSGLGQSFAGHLQYQHLKILDLGSNCLGDEGVKALCTNWSTVLAFLNLPDNRIGDAGACALANVASSLQSLCLCQNAIGDVGAHALASLRLDYLFCWDNAFGETGKETLSNACSKQLYWVRPYHWDQELGLAREKALIVGSSLKRNNLRSTKPVMPTSPAYDRARTFLDERYASMREKKSQQKTGKKFTTPENAQKKQTESRNLVSVQEQASSSDSLAKALPLYRQNSGIGSNSSLSQEKPRYGQSCRDWKRGNISLSAMSYNLVEACSSESNATVSDDDLCSVKAVLTRRNPSVWDEATRQQQKLEPSGFSGALVMTRQREKDNTY